MLICETERLRLDEYTEDDAAFVLDLLNEPAFHQYIGDRGVRTLDDARRYITDRLCPSYTAHDFGLWRVALKNPGTPIGMCGLIKRALFDEVDIGFAFLKSYEGHGYGFEAASAVLAHARERLGLTRLLGIVAPDNARSIRLLTRLGLTHERAFTWPDDGSVVDIYGRAL